MFRRARRCAAAITGIVALTGVPFACAPVPDLRFDDGAQGEAGADSPKGAADAAEGGADSKNDAPPALTCPGPVPKGVTCCGSKVCVQCASGDCTACDALVTCAGTEAAACCGTKTTKANVVCMPAAACH